MAYSRWVLMFDTCEEAHAQRLLENSLRLLEHPVMDSRIELGIKNGYVARFQLQHQQTQSHHLAEIVTLGETLGHGWQLDQCNSERPSGTLDGTNPAVTLHVEGLCWVYWELYLLS